MKLSATATEPYSIDVPESILNDLYKRLENTRWPQSPDLGWDGGMDANYLREFCDYWREKYSWRRAVPAAFALFPADIGHPPREWAERFFNVQRWTEMPRGGHFAAMEEPELLAADLREWFRQFR